MFYETCLGPVNIALIKYWGKRDENLILPINDSLSMTLSIQQMCAKTTVAASEQFTKNTMWLNGEEVPFEDNTRLMRCIKSVQTLATKHLNCPNFPLDWKLHIVSQNNFPTAAGLASSAAGYACLVYTLACLYGVEKQELTAIARLGSGSACRSLDGGFIRWHMGELSDGSDSIATVVEPNTHWPDMHVLILVVNDARKKTGSTQGMQRSVMTSELIKYRAEHCVPQRISEITRAIKERNFEKFAEIAMQDSNQFHAVALDTFPPCVYMNDVSHAIIDFVHAYNKAAGSAKVAYTFDAGPNACLFLLEENVSAVLSAVLKSFPNDADKNVEYLQGIPVDFSQNAVNEHLNGRDSLLINKRNLLKYIIHTQVGLGPKRLKKIDALINTSTGLPL